MYIFNVQIIVFRSFKITFLQFLLYKKLSTRITWHIIDAIREENKITQENARSSMNDRNFWGNIYKFMDTVNTIAKYKLDKAEWRILPFLPEARIIPTGAKKTNGVKGFHHRTFSKKLIYT